MRIRLSQLEAFTAVVEQRGITAASDHLGWSKSKVSKLLSELEELVGVSLFYRSTRAMKLTGEGQQFYEDSRDNLAAIRASVERLQSTHDELSGHLRVAAPLIFTRNVLNPAIHALSAEGVSLGISLSDERSDLDAREHDVYIRIGELEDGDYYAKRIGQTELMMVASPDYLAKMGAPLDLDRLMSADVLRYAQHGRVVPWLINGHEVAVNPKAKVVSNNGDYLVESCVAGIGITQLPDFMARGYLNSGQLVEVFPELPADAIPIHVLYFERARQSRLLSHFIDVISAQVKSLCATGCRA